MNSRNILSRLFAQSRGFTLMEVSLALGILSLGLGLVGTSIFQVFDIQRSWQDQRVATKETRHAASWFAGDALKAKATNLVDNDPPVDSVTLTLGSGDVTYSRSGDTLLRDAGGDQNVIAQDVVSTGFSLDGEVMTLTVEVAASGGNTETINLKNYLRMLE